MCIWFASRFNSNENRCCMMTLEMYITVANKAAWTKEAEGYRGLAQHGPAQLDVVWFVLWWKYKRIKLAWIWWRREAESRGSCSGTVRRPPPRYSPGGSWDPPDLESIKINLHGWKQETYQLSIRFSWPEMEVEEIILAKVSRLCQLLSHSRGFLSKL